MGSVPIFAVDLSSYSDLFTKTGLVIVIICYARCKKLKERFFDS